MAKTSKSIMLYLTTTQNSVPSRMTTHKKAILLKKLYLSVLLFFFFLTAENSQQIIVMLEAFTMTTCTKISATSSFFMRDFCYYNFWLSVSQFCFPPKYLFFPLNFTQASSENLADLRRVPMAAAQYNNAKDNAENSDLIFFRSCDDW